MHLLLLFLERIESFSALFFVGMFPMLPRTISECECGNSIGQDAKNRLFSLDTRYARKKKVIPAVPMDNFRSTAELVQESSDGSKIYLVEAAIVRIMKARRRMDFRTLVNEVISQLSVRFSAPSAFVKERVEDLITREFLCRKEDGMTVEYVA